MHTPLNEAQLAALRQINTPTVSNIVELFGVRDRREGFMSNAVRCLFPEMGVMVGYAVTATSRALHPPKHDALKVLFAYYDAAMRTPAPRVSVIADLDDPPGVGAFFGEVNTNIHKAQGFVGHVTNGASRDLDEVRVAKFHLFASGPCVSHAHIHLVQADVPVTVGGLLVQPGDLIHADQHGVMAIPLEIAAEVAGRLADIEAKEGPIIRLCQSQEFTLAKLKVFIKSRKGKEH
ncbi:MAG: RraA family protein [Deinococcus sp.]|nr:RraA family protein [Deinococcus sp.]